ncbi:MAG: IPT/TIG domain-containing protein, partial [Acidimicrobiales bacterium]
MAAAVPATTLSAVTLAGSPSAGAATTAIPTVTAVSPVDGPVVGAAAPPPVNREAGAFPVYGEATGNDSLAVAPVKVGDLVVLSMQLHTSGVLISGISGGNVASWQRAVSYTNTTTDSLHYEVWWGVAAATGPATATINYTGAASQFPIELVADSFTTATPLTWSVVATGGSSNPSSSSTTFPPLTSGTATDQLYWGVSEEESAGTSTPTPGFAGNDTANANCFLYDGGLTPGTVYAPTCGEYPANVSTAAGVIFAAGGASTSNGTGGTAVTVTGTNFAAGDTVHFGGSSATSVTVASSTSITAVAPPGSPAVVGGTVDVTVTGPGGTSATSPADEFTYLVTSTSYAISLSTSGTTPGIGAPVTLTATANRDVGPTPYGMSIVDASTGVIVSHAGTGSTFSAVVSQDAALTQRYVAEIDNAGGINIQASSLPVVVTWSGSVPPPPTTGPPPTYTEANGFPIYARASGLSSISLAPMAVGDLVVLVVELHSGAGPTVTGLSSPNITWASTASAVDTDTSVPLHLEVWSGVATSASAGTTTVTY